MLTKGRHRSTTTSTVTAVVSAVNTVVITATTSATVATNTVVYTFPTTTTIPSTNVVSQTATAVVTTTTLQTAAPVTSTTTVYENPPATIIVDRGALVERGNPFGIPDYAWPACQNWNQYVDACRCFGIIPFTSTAHPTTTTVTVTAATAITTTVSTLTTTTTTTIPVTASTLLILSPTIAVIDVFTTTETITESSTLTVVTTTTPTVVATQTCEPLGTPFRAFVQENGNTLYLGSPDGFSLSWDSYANPDSVTELERTTFMLNDDGYLRLDYQVDDDHAEYAYIDVSLPANTDRLYLGSIGSIDQVENFKQVSGCVDATTGVLSLSAVGKTYLLECNGVAMLSSDAGSGVTNCVVVGPDTEDSS